jgi:hypothetical protein
MTKRNLPDIIDIAKGSAASAVGVGVGTAIAGPIGGIAGGIAASSLDVLFRKYVSKHIHHNLSINEEERLRKVLSQFNTKMVQNLSVGSGKTLRQDSFSEEKINQRSAAEEIFEGVLFAVEREYEEKKVKFEGNFYANILFDSRIDKASANFLLRLAQSLSYGQLCIVTLFVQKGKFHLRQESYRNIPQFNDNHLLALLQEIHQLSSQGLLFVDGEMMASPFDVIPTKMEAVGPIQTLYLLMDLEEIEQSDIKVLAEQLSIDRQVGYKSTS